jgi:CHRD domain
MKGANKMKRLVIFAVLLIVGSVPAALTADNDSANKSHHFSAKLSGYNEVHFNGGSAATDTTPFTPATLRGAISTKAKGTFRARLRKNMDVIDYELNYEGLEGTVTQAHIHFGQRHTVGGIVVWLCQTVSPDNSIPAAPAPPPVDPIDITPLCPAEGTVKGTITPFEVLAQTAQGIAAEEFEELVRALRAGAAYANVHSSLFGPGEIRGQIRDSH